ncbi:autophagy-related protein 13-domain-containing protein [Scleroderma yunnanense]
MSNDIQKADQIAYRFYSKLTLVVNHARSTVDNRPNTKLDKWFNLETPDSDLFRDPLRIYRTISSSAPPPPPFELQVLLSIPEISSNQVLVYLAPDSSRLRIDPTPQHIVLESWLLHFAPSTPTARSPYRNDDHDDNDEHPGDVAPSTIYKHGIPLFRSIYSLLRILPSWKLFKRLRRRMSSPYRTGNMNIQLRIKGADDGVGDLLEFDTPPTFNARPLPYETHSFPPIPHPMGTLSLTAKYLTSPNFQLDELESLLSSRFLSLDEASDFTPTLAKNQPRDSMSALAGPSGSSLRTSLPKSPPSSIAGQFILPPPTHPGTHLRTNSMPGSHSPRGGHAALPISRTSTGAAGAGSTSALSITSSRQDGSGTWSKEESALPSIARLRRESTSATARSSLDLPSAPGPLPIRKPGITTVHPFRSSTLSSGSPSIHSPSPSLRQPSPLSGGGAPPSLPARPSAQTSPNSSRVPPSPIGAGASTRPSPPFAPSSLSDRRSLASADGVDPGDAATNTSSSKVPTRKRYSSSFGHRYAASGGSVGSGGSGGAGSVGGTGGGGAGGGVGLGGTGMGSEESPGSTGVIGIATAANAGVGIGIGIGIGTERESSREPSRERQRVASLLGTAVTSEEDELSMFVREIDARKPLASTGTLLRASAGALVEGSSRGVVGLGIGVGVSQAENPGVGSTDTRIEPSSRPVSGSAAVGVAAVHPGADPGAHAAADATATADPSSDSRRSSTLGSGPMLTREAEVDERLRHMHRVFMASLEGLGSGTRRSGLGQTHTGDSSPVGDGGSASASVSASAGGGSGMDQGAQRPHLGSMRSLSGGDGTSSGGSAEVLGRMELDEEMRRRRRFGA